MRRDIARAEWSQAYGNCGLRLIEGRRHLLDKYGMRHRAAPFPLTGELNKIRDRLQGFAADRIQRRMKPSVRRITCDLFKWPRQKLPFLVTLLRLFSSALTERAAFVGSEAGRRKSITSTKTRATTTRRISPCCAYFAMRILR